MDYEEYNRAITYDSLSEEINGLKIVISRLEDREFDLECEVERLREESKKKGDVLTTLDEMIRNYASHVEMMKALEQGLGLLETWKEMIE